MSYKNSVINLNTITMNSTHYSSHDLMVLTCVHLPDIDGAIRASHYQVVIGRAPFDDLDGEKVSGRKHDALLLPQTEQTNGMIAGYGANTVLHPSLDTQDGIQPGLKYRKLQLLYTFFAGVKKQEKISL